ncbi:MAG: pyridoxal-phosphate dependent enzyme [Spirochaetaceae bacterium]|nr:pyridoxal-phosphate dependent enzyme [Spirochaetaceae bacterium]
MNCTPLYKLYSDGNNNLIYIKRDDLLPFSFGGNKVRIAYEFIKDMKMKKKDCIIGYGNSRSNLSRALSNICANESIPCYIVSPTDDDGNITESFNASLTKCCGGNFVKCTKESVADTVDHVFSLCVDKGLSPYYINGNKFGKGNEAIPVRAYFEAYNEIVKWEKSQKIEFDYIFLPVGTGMTQAGLLCGAERYKRKTDIIGISIARAAAKVKDDIQEYISGFREKGVPIVFDNQKVIVDDLYLCGGYSKYNDSIMEVIQDIYANYGIPLDLTYTGKAFYGMKNYIKLNNIKEKNILFLHTGGTPLFFDYLKMKNEKKNIVQCNDIGKLLPFLQLIDKELPVRLSVRVDLERYAKKILDNGIVLGIEEDGKLCAAALFYCNDETTRTAYLSLIGVLPYYCKQGYANQLLDETIAYSRKCGMLNYSLDVDVRNTKAISLYSKKGFIIEKNQGRLYMKKCISSLKYDMGGGYLTL